MNKERRKRIEKIISKIQEIQEEVEIILEEEVDYRDNIPENLQGSEKYIQSDEYCDLIESAVADLENAVGELKDVI